MGGKFNLLSAGICFECIKHIVEVHGNCDIIS